MKGREEIATEFIGSMCLAGWDLMGGENYFNEVCFRQGLHVVLYVKLYRSARTMPKWGSWRRKGKGWG